MLCFLHHRRMSPRSAQKQLEELAQGFDLATKIKFLSGKFAAMSIHGSRRDWEVWGDCESVEQAQAAAQMWSAAFHQRSTALPR